MAEWRPDGPFAATASSSSSSPSRIWISSIWRQLWIYVLKEDYAFQNIILEYSYYVQFIYTFVVNCEFLLLIVHWLGIDYLYDLFKTISNEFN